MFGRGTTRTGRRVTGVAVAGMLAMTAACGDGGGPEPERPAASAPAPDQAPPAAQGLENAALADGRRIGPYAVRKPDEPPFSENYTADPASCQPLVSLAPGATTHDPVAEAHRQADIPEEAAGIGVLVQLRTYEGDGAAAVLRDLAAAGESCAGGFTEVRTLARAKVLSVEPAEAPALGDEAKAFRITVRDVKEDLKLYEYLTVVRSGRTTLSFRADYMGTKDVGGVPKEIVEAQWKQFTDAGSGST